MFDLAFFFVITIQNSWQPECGLSLSVSVVTVVTVGSTLQYEMCKKIHIYSCFPMGWHCTSVWSSYTSAYYTYIVGRQYCTVESPPNTKNVYIQPWDDLKCSGFEVQECHCRWATLYHLLSLTSIQSPAYFFSSYELAHLHNAWTAGKVLCNSKTEFSYTFSLLLKLCC